MAQLGDYERARKLLRRAAHCFGARERLAARCQVAEVEVALAARDLSQPPRARHSDAGARRAWRSRQRAPRPPGRGAPPAPCRRARPPSDDAAVKVAAADAPPALAARVELTRGELALRGLRVADAAAARPRPRRRPRRRIPALVAEIGRARRTLSAPSARLISAGVVRPVRLMRSRPYSLQRPCRRCPAGARFAVGVAVFMAGRPVLFALVGALAEAWPGPMPAAIASSSVLSRRALPTSRIRPDSHRARSRARRSVPAWHHEANSARLAHRRRRARVVVVYWPRRIDGPAGSILALLVAESSSDLGARPCARLEPANRPARLASARRGDGGARRRTRSLRRRLAPVRRIRDNLVTPRRAAYRVVLDHDDNTRVNPSRRRSSANTGPYPGIDQIHGVTFDGTSGCTRRKHRRARSRERALIRELAVAADAGTAFDGEHTAPCRRSNPEGRPRLRVSHATIPAPPGRDSGPDLGRGTLWVGEYTTARSTRSIPRRAFCAPSSPTASSPA